MLSKTKVRVQMNQIKLNNVNFENDIRSSILKEFAKYGQQIDTDIDLLNVIHSYTNWRKRFVGYGRREVLFTKELKNNPLYRQNKKLQKVVNKIAYKLKNAEDLTPFLSKGVVDYPLNDIRRRDIDLMLNAFNIHHLHLGNDREENMKYGVQFTKRKDELLFARITKSKVYFINIYKHDFPYKEDIFKVIQNNWEHLLEPYEMRDIIDINHYSEDATKQLLKKHCNTAISINGKYYMIGSVSMSGHSNNGMFDIYSLFDIINRYENIFLLNKNQILYELNSKLHMSLEDIKIQIVIENGMLFFLEKQSNRCIVMNSTLNYIISYDACIIGNHSLDLNS